MTTVALLAIVVLVLINGFFVAAEFALVSARPERMTGPETGVRRLVRRQMGSLDEYLAACQLGITIASLALGAIGEPTIANLIEPALGSRLAADAVAVIATIGALLIMTALHITIGEQAPKSFAIGSAERVVVLVRLAAGDLPPQPAAAGAAAERDLERHRARVRRPAGDRARRRDARGAAASDRRPDRVGPGRSRRTRGCCGRSSRSTSGARSEVLTPRSRVIAVREDGVGRRRAGGAR